VPSQSQDRHPLIASTHTPQVVHTCVCISVCVCMYVHVCLYVCVCMCVRESVYVFVSACACAISILPSATTCATQLTRVDLCVCGGADVCVCVCLRVHDVRTSAWTAQIIL